MKEIPIDKTRICERILETGQYQTDEFKDKEDWWLVKYLKLKYNKNSISEKELKEKIKKIWEIIYLTRFTEEERREYQLYIDKRFNDVYNNCKNVSLSQKYNSFDIYQEELDYINSLPAARWIREFIFIFLGHCKTKNSFINEYAPILVYLPYLSLKARDKDLASYTIYAKLNEWGLWEEKTIVTIVDDHRHEPEERIDIRFDFLFPVVKKGSNPIHFDGILDLLKRLDLITNIYRCEKCGKSFEIKNRTQRFICEDCYKKQRQKRKNYARDQRRKTPL